MDKSYNELTEALDSGYELDEYEMNLYYTEQSLDWIINSEWEEEIL